MYRKKLNKVIMTPALPFCPISPSAEIRQWKYLFCGPAGQVALYLSLVPGAWCAPVWYPHKRKGVPLTKRQTWSFTGC